MQRPKPDKRKKPTAGEGRNIRMSILQFPPPETKLNAAPAEALWAVVTGAEANPVGAAARWADTEAAPAWTRLAAAVSKLALSTSDCVLRTSAASASASGVPATLESEIFCNVPSNVAEAPAVSPALLCCAAVVRS